MPTDPTNTERRERVAVRRRAEHENTGAAPVLLRLPDLNRSLGSIPALPQTRPTKSETAAPKTVTRESLAETDESPRQGRVLRTLTMLLERVTQLTSGSKKFLVIVMVLLLIVLTLLVIQSTLPSSAPDSEPPIQWEQTVDGSATTTEEPSVVFNESKKNNDDVANSSSPMLFLPDSNADVATDGTAMNFEQLQGDQKSDVTGVQEPGGALCYYSTDAARQHQEQHDADAERVLRTAQRLNEDGPSPTDAVAPQPQPTPQLSPPIPNQRGAQYENTGYPEFIPPRYRTSSPAGAGTSQSPRTGFNTQVPRNERTGSGLY